MADKDTAPKLLALESDSEAIAEASKTPSVDQPGMLNQTDPSVSVSSAAQENLSASKIDQDARMSSNTIEPSISESSSIQISPNTVVGESEGEQQTVEDGSKMPLGFPRNENATSSIAGVANRTGDPPSLRQPLCTCMCCCFRLNYNILEDEQQIPFYIHYARKIRNSKYVLLVLVALLAVPISSIYFGVAYKDSCPMSQFSPVLLIIMGIVGVTLIFVRLVTVSIRSFRWSMEEPPKTIPISLLFMLMVLLIIEMVSFYIPIPDFENLKDPAFCAKTFYDYVYCMNIAALATVILASLLHIPQKPRSAVQILPQ